MLTLYTNGCVKCKILKEMLNKAGLEYTPTDDFFPIARQGFAFLPVLHLPTGEFLGVDDAVKYIQNR